MSRIRRVSLEVIRRELSLSMTRPMVERDEMRPRTPSAEANDVPDGPLQAPLCPECESSLFVLPTGGGEASAIVQLVLRAHEIHCERSCTGELLVCVRSFELHSGASAVAKVTEPAGPQEQSSKLSPIQRPRDD